MGKSGVRGAPVWAEQTETLKDNRNRGKVETQGRETTARQQEEFLENTKH